MKILPITVLTFFLAAGLGQAATTGRILTNGKVSMYKNGKVTSSFSQQGPIDENALIACEGTCLVKLKGVSLFAGDQSKFALKELAEEIKLYVAAGKVKFTASNTSKQFVFYTTDGYIVKTEGFITPVSTDKIVKGFVQVNDEGTEIGMDHGAMVVQTRNGSKTVREGQSLILAQVPPEEKKDDKAAAAVLEGGSSVEAAAAGGAAGAGAAGGSGGGAGGITLGGVTLGTGGLVVGGVVITTVAAAVLNEGYKYDLTTNSEPTPTPTPRPTASPNR